MDAKSFHLTGTKSNITYLKKAFSLECFVQKQ